MRPPILAVAVMLLSTAAVAQPTPERVRPGQVVRSNVDRTIGKVERVGPVEGGRFTVVVVSYDQPPKRKLVSSDRIAEAGEVVRLSIGRAEFDALPDG